jgi:predicted transglutaminase-like cysteine proteinase
MKTLTTLLILIGLMITACDYESYLLQEGKIKIGNIYDYSFSGSEEIPEFETIEQVYNFLQSRIEKKKDIDVYGIAEYYQLPEETWKIKSGDCEDFSLLFQYIVKKQFNYDSDLIIADISLNKNEYHVISYIHNIDKFVDSISHCIMFANDTFLNKIKCSISYSEALWMTKYYHQPVGKYEF